MQKKAAVNIFFAGEDPLDKNFANQIAEEVRKFTEVHLNDVDEFDRIDEISDKRPERYSGVPVYVLSDSLLEKVHHRRKLLRATPSVGKLPGLLAFYIYRGKDDPDKIRRRYPEFEDLFDQIMIGNESQLKTMLSELQAYIEYKFEQAAKKNQRLLLPTLLKLSFASIAIPSYFFAWLLYLLSFIGTGTLIYRLLIAPDLRSEFWLSLIALYGAGFCLTRLDALDFWLWLGPQWKILEPGYIVDSHFQSLLQSWSHKVDSTRFIRLALLVSLVLPSTAAISRYSWSMILIAIVALAIGILFPSCFYWATHFMQKVSYRELGLTEKELERGDKFYPSWQWSISPWFGSGTKRRAWFTRRPYLFISHTWKDDDIYPVVKSLPSILEGLHIEFFFDKRNIESEFSAWRLEIIEPILDCTHLLVVIGPKILESKRRIVLREIRTALQRRYTELFPTIICITEPDYAKDLLNRDDLPRELRFVLTECPQITIEEICRVKPLQYLLKQRCHQGLLLDWVTLLYPEWHLKRMKAYHESII